MASTFCLLFLVCVVSAQSNTSAPAHHGPEVGWQSSPGRRGTLDIIISCMTTIFACTWSIQHLNVPGRNDTSWTNLARGAKWMAITILLPEFTLAHAVFELDMAIKAKKKVNSKPSDTPVDAENLSWSTKLAQIWKSTWESASSPIFTLCKSALSKPKSLGGTEKSDNQRPESPAKDQTVKSAAGDRPTPKWTLRHCYFANMGGLYYRDEQSNGPDKDSREIRFPLTAFQYAKYHSELNLPELTKESIKDKSKQDIFAKIVASFQISYLVLSIGVRRYRHLPFTQLEVLTLGFAVCGIVTYSVYWFKPQNVKVAIDVTPKRGATEKPAFFQPGQESFWRILKNHKSYNKVDQVERIRNDNIAQESSEATHAMLPVLLVLSVVFNSIHLLGWNATFPTQAESILWKTFMLYSIIVPGIGLAIILLSQLTLPAGDPAVFVADCYGVLEEMAWYYSDEKRIRMARDSLGKAHRSEEKSPTRKTKFEKIFRDKTPATTATSGSAIPEPKDDSEPSNGPSDNIGPDVNLTSALQEGILQFIKLPVFTERMPPEVVQRFPANFKRLVEHMDGRATKKLSENAKTYVFPRKSLGPNSLNLATLYITSLLYTVSRLAMLALALSSLRSMPEGVYVTTWTRYLPSFH